MLSCDTFNFVHIYYHIVNFSAFSFYVGIIYSETAHIDKVSGRSFGKVKMKRQGVAVSKKLKFNPRTRTGMTVCADHGWQKRGFDSLTGKRINYKSVMWNSAENCINFHFTP